MRTKFAIQKAVHWRVLDKTNSRNYFFRTTDDIRKSILNNMSRNRFNSIFRRKGQKYRRLSSKDWLERYTITRI